MTENILTEIEKIKAIDGDLTFTDIIIALRDALKQISEKLLTEYKITFNIVVKFSKTGLEATFVVPKNKLAGPRPKSLNTRIQKLYKKILKKISDFKEKIEDLIDNEFLNKLVLSIGFDIWKFEISATLTFEASS